MAEVSLSDLAERWRAVARAQQRCPAGAVDVLRLACEEQGLVELRRDREWGPVLRRAELALRAGDVAEIGALYADAARAAARFPEPEARIVDRLVAALEPAAASAARPWAPRLALGVGLAALVGAAWRVFR